MRRSALAVALSAAAFAASAWGVAGGERRSPERRDYWCDDGRRALGLFGDTSATLNVDHFGVMALTAVPDAAAPDAAGAARPTTYRSDAFAGGPVIAIRTGETLRLVSPGWPDTLCRP